MLSQAKAKLNSKRGVSVMLALLLFLICILSGTAALTAAGSNIGRYAYIRETQQQYLAVSSATRLIKDQLEAASDNLSVVFIDATHREYSYNGHSFVEADGPYDNGTLQIVWKGIDTLLKTAAKNHSSGKWNDIAPGSMPATLNYTISVEGDDVLKEYPVDLEIKFDSIGGMGEQKNQCKVTFYLTNGSYRLMLEDVTFKAVTSPEGSNLRVTFEADAGTIRRGAVK